VRGTRNFVWRALVLAALVAFGVARADGVDTATTESDPHAHHHMMAAAPAPVRRSEARYEAPPVTLVRDDGQAVSLRDVLATDEPVVLAFIYTSCTTVCPLTTQTLAQLETRLGQQRPVRLVSISIDPEQDTPARLAEYAHAFHAGPNWRHYTGTLAASQSAQRAFDVYRGNKMNHSPAILVRPTADSAWVRFDGFATVDQLLAELPGTTAITASR